MRYGLGYGAGFRRRRLAAAGGGGAVPNGALTINGKPITINGSYITIGA